MYPDIPVTRLTVLSEAIIESCLKVSLNRERTRVSMTLREHISNAEIFRSTLLVYMQFSNLPDHFSDNFQKRKHDMKNVTVSIAAGGDCSESEDMIKFLAVIRKQGIDIM